jgi:hypothetical protein
MPQPAVSGATMQCSFGLAPSTLNVVPLPTTPVVEGRPMATIMDAKPMVNIPPFGMCTSLANPTVAAATASALGVLTPMPCVPVTAAWTPAAPLTIVAGQPALASGSVCMCSWGGVIQLLFPGTATTQVS